MSAIDRVLNRLGLTSTKQFNTMVEEAVKVELDKVHYWLGETADAQRWEIPSTDIFANQADLYRLSPILGTAVDILSRDIGTAKFNVKRMVGEEERDIPNHEFEVLLRSPNPLDSGLELMQYTVSNYLLNGNSIWWQNKADKYSRPDEIWPIPFENITPVPDKFMYLDHWDYFPGMGKEAIRMEPWEIIVFKNYNPHNRFVGLSPLESLVTTIQGDLGMRQTNKTTYTDYGGAPQSILAFKDFVNNEAWADIKKEKVQAAKRNEMMMLRGVGDGVSWLGRALTNKDMDFVAGLQQNMTDVFNRLCPGLVSMLSENSTEANALAARATYAEKTLWPMMEVIAQKVTSDILPAYGRKLKGEFDDPRVVDRALELEEQAAFERSHTIEEVRKEKYGDDPLGDERDKLFIGEIKVKASTFGADNGAQPQDEQPQENEAEQDTSAEEVSMKAALDDLRTWRKIALRGKTEKAVRYNSDYIPASVLRAVKAELANVSDKAKIADIFDNAIEQMKPKPKLDPAQLLQGIELGVKALELQNGKHS